MAQPVKGPHSGPKEALLAYARAVGSKRLNDVQAFVNELYNQTIFDGFLIAVQSIHETDAWRSDYWENHLNPAGLGITYSGEPSKTWNSGTDAARAVLLHHAAYTGTALPESWRGWLPLNTRYQLAKETFGGTVSEWDDYGNGKWAVDPDYYAGIVKREAEVRKYATASPVPEGDFMPNIIDKWLHVAQDGYGAVNRRIIGRYGMQPKVIVLHIQEGYNSGSWQYFHVVSASSTVLIGQNGDIWRLVPESDGPWTNGDVKSPTARGWAIINKYGADPNVYSLTIETEGFTGWWPKPQEQLDAVVWQIRQWMDRYDIPLENVIKHAEINSVDRRYCPGDAFYNYVIAELKKGGGVSQPMYMKADPILVNGKPWDGKTNVTVNDKTFYGEIRKVKTTKETPVRAFATATSASTRSSLKSGTDVSVIGWVVGEKVNGEDRWWITKAFSRISAADTAEKPKAVIPASEEDIKPDVPPGVKYFRGKMYYPVDDDLSELTIVAKSANLRQDATTKSRVLGKVVRDQKVKPVYWTFGDEVNEESVWWVLENTEGKEPLKHGPRLWVAATALRPD